MSTGSGSALEPVAIGPTWQRTDTGWLLPELTLGWDVLAWTAEFFRQPDGPDAGQPWRYTDEQARFILWFYAIDATGRFLHRYAMLRRAKGWGKDPVAATICGTEFVGPCRFGGFDAHGQPVGIKHPAPWVLTAAVAKDQTRNTMTLFPGLFSDELIKLEKIDLGKEIIYAARGRRRLEAVTSSPRALEGARSSFTLKNETQHWLRNNEGHAMSEVIARNQTKSRDGAARTLAISNAHNPGEDSDAEHDWDGWQAIDQGKSRATGFLYDSLEAPPGVDLADEEQLRAGLAISRGDSIWLDIDRHVEEIYDPRNSPSTSRRFYLNQLVAAEDAWIAPHEYDQLAEPADVLEGEQITMGFDGSKSDDHTALRGCRIDDGYVFTLGIWDPADYDGEAPREMIDETVETAHQKYDVLGFFGDLHPFESYIDKWAERHGRGYVTKASQKHAVAWDMRSRTKDFTIECERLHDEIVEKAFRHDGDPRARQHFHNARRRPNAWGVSVGKEHRESPHKIDSVPATVLARMARRLVLTSPKRRPRRSGKAVFT
ncbi:MAG: Terminase [Acidimicrobiales bacterium]|nr:Terminase [Acidimicrobiales bacterium]